MDETPSAVPSFGSPVCRGHFRYLRRPSRIPMIIFKPSSLSWYYTVNQHISCCQHPAKTLTQAARVANPVRVHVCQNPRLLSFLTYSSPLQCASGDVYSVIRHPISWIKYLCLHCISHALIVIEVVTYYGYTNTVDEQCIYESPRDPAPQPLPTPAAKRI